MIRQNQKRIISMIIALIIAVACMPIFSATTLAATTVADGMYTFVSGVGSSMVLDVYAGSTANKANVQIYKSNGTEAQQFMVTKIGSHYSIINVKSGKALDVYGGSKKNKANVWQYTWNQTDAQLWDFIDAGGGHYYVQNVGSGKVLDVKGGKAVNKTNVWQYTKNNSKILHTARYAAKLVLIRETSRFF